MLVLQAATVLALPHRQLNLAQAEAVRIEAIADSGKDAKDRADQYISIARDLKKEARKLERQADALLQDAAA